MGEWSVKKAVQNEERLTCRLEYNMFTIAWVSIQQVQFCSRKLKRWSFRWVSKGSNWVLIQALPLQKRSIMNEHGSQLLLQRWWTWKKKMFLFEFWIDLRCAELGQREAWQVTGAATWYRVFVLDLGLPFKGCWRLWKSPVWIYLGKSKQRFGSQHIGIIKLYNLQNVENLWLSSLNIIHIEELIWPVTGLGEHNHQFRSKLLFKRTHKLLEVEGNNAVNE